MASGLNGDGHTDEPRHPVMRVLDVCAGIGVVSLVADWLGMEIAGQIEIDPFCQAILHQHWPHVKRLADIHEVHGNEFGAVDLVAAGFPCQPSSLAGKRRGPEDDRWLWPEVYRLITTLRPRWVVLENTPGLLSLGIDEVLADLEGKTDQDPHYDAQVWVLPASAVGAPHQRQRVFIMAHTRRAGQPAWSPPGRAAPLGELFNDWVTGSSTSVADPTRLPQREPANQKNSLTTSGETRQESRGRSGVGLADASSAGFSFRQRATREWAQPTVARSVGRDVESRLGRSLDGIAGWLDSFRWPAGPREAQYDWEPPRTTQERLPHRTARLHALGNAIVPTVLLPIFAAILTADPWEAEGTL